MSKYRVKVNTDLSLAGFESFSIDNVEFKSDDKLVYGELVVIADDMMDAHIKALDKFSLVINSLAKVSKQTIKFYITEVTEIDSDTGINKSIVDIKSSIRVRIPITQNHIQESLNLAKLTCKNKKLAQVLAFINNDNYKSWMTLYKIQEIIKSDCKLEKLQVSKSKLRRFKQTANHPEASGPDSRHGFLKGQPPEIPMKLNEAVEFIEDIIEKWIAKINKEVE